MLITQNVQTGFAITPSDTVNTPNLIQAIWVGTTGDITVIDSAGSSETFKSVPVGMFSLNFLAQRVMATGTTASSMVGFSNGVIPSNTNNFGAFAVTPSDTVNLLQVCDALYVGVAGNVSLQMASGVQVTLNNVPTGWLTGVGFARVYSTGTTATNMVAVPNTGLAFNSAEEGVTIPTADARYGRLASANTWSALNTFSAGIKFGSGQTLQNYEEGNWTVSVRTTGANVLATLSSPSSTYIRIGKLMICQCTFGISSLNGGTGNVQFLGLPYACNATQAGTGHIGENPMAFPVNCRVTAGDVVVQVFTNNVTVTNATIALGTQTYTFIYQLP